MSGHHPFGPGAAGPSTPADRAAQALADAVLEAPEPTGHFWVVDAFIAVRAAALVEQPSTREGWTRLVDAEARRCAYLSVGDAVRDIWAGRARRIRRWSFDRGLRLVDDLIGRRKAAAA